MPNALYYDNGMFDRIRRGAAKSLLAAATLLQREQVMRTGYDNPKPYLDSSKPGEYPRRRSGVGQLSCIIDPGTVDAIMEQGYVWVGYSMFGFNYMDFLVNARDRLGLERTLRDLQTRLELEALNNFKEQ